MPELPEVETIVRELQQTKLIGAKIQEVEVLHYPKIVMGMTPKNFRDRLVSQKVIEIRRRGKFIVFDLSNDVLAVHLRMTGKLYLTKPDQLHENHVHVKFYFADGNILYYEDQRKFGRWFLQDRNAEQFTNLGIEPLSEEFTLEAFQKLIKTHKVQIKPFLLNQRYIAGLGNIYVDEALWEARIYPKVLTNLLTKKQMKDLFHAIQEVLRKGIEHRGTTIGKFRGNYMSLSGARGKNQNRLNVYQRTGLPCNRCGELIVKTVIGQRGTHYCPVCQSI